MGFEVQLTGVVRRLLQWLVFVSAPVVEQVFQAQEHCPYEHHCACCFKWDHRVGMIHSIAQAAGPERLRGYGYSGVTGTNVRCVVNAPGVTKLPVPKIPETDTELLAGNHLHFASNLS